MQEEWPLVALSSPNNGRAGTSKMWGCSTCVWMNRWKKRFFCPRFRLKIPRFVWLLLDKVTGSSLKLLGVVDLYNMLYLCLVRRERRNCCGNSKVDWFRNRKRREQERSLTSSSSRHHTLSILCSKNPIFAKNTCWKINKEDTHTPSYSIFSWTDSRE